MTRITQSMLTSNYLINNNRNLGNMQTLQYQLSSGKLINKVSDNPYKSGRIMQLYTEIDVNNQFKANIKDASSWLDATDTALGEINNILSRIRELQVKAGNGTYKDSELEAIQLEIKEKTKQINQILNTNFDGHYLFGGTKNTSKSVMLDSNGNIKYCDKDGNEISVYKECYTDNGTTKFKYTTNSMPSEPSTEITLPLTTAQKDALRNELNSADTTESRKNDIRMIIGNGEQVYKKTYNSVLSFNSNGGTAVVPAITELTRDQITALNNEMDDESTTELRREEIKKILETDFSSGSVTLYTKDIENYTTDKAQADKDSVTNQPVKYELTDLDVTNLKKELENSNISDNRKAAINDLLDTTGKATKIYKRVDGTITTSCQNEPVILTDSEIKDLKDEYNLATTDAARKSELEKIFILTEQINADLDTEVSEGVMLTYNVTACDILTYKSSDGSTKSVTDILDKIINNLGEQGSIITNVDGTQSIADSSEVGASLLEEMDSIIDNLLSQRSKVGALSNRMEDSLERNKSDNESMTTILSKTEDIDYAETMIEYSTMQTLYQASLQVSARILQNTLLDYL